jgi:hypothetical protein
MRSRASRSSHPHGRHKARGPCGRLLLEPKGVADDRTLDRLDGKPAPQAFLPTFLQWIDSAEASRQPSAGLGDDVRLRGERVIGSGLELDGELLQLSAFRSENAGRAHGRIARPSARH